MNAHTNSEYGRLSEATQCFGLSRSCLYLLAGRKTVRFVKIGKATLVDFGSVRSYLEALPTAQLGENRNPLAVGEYGYELRRPRSPQSRPRVLPAKS